MWQPVDTEFYCRRHPVAIAALGDVGHDAVFARALLEELGAVVHLHLIGTPGDFLKVLSRGSGAAPYLVISAHGEPTGIRFGEYAEGIDTSMLEDGILTPERIAETVDLPGCVVVNESCFGGEAALAEAFMRGGLGAYIGTVEPDPDACAWPLFLAHFFYELFHRRRTEREARRISAPDVESGALTRAAWRRAASYDDETRLFVYYDQEGLHRA